MPKYVQPLVFLISLVPFLLLIYFFISDTVLVTDHLGANPIEEITHFTGSWTLYFLLITLAITPIRKLTGYNHIIRLRRMLGLFAFFYGCLHFSTYFILDQFFDWQEIAKDIVKRPYITVGFTAFVLLIPLAVTSTNNMMKRLGKNWNKLHKTVYVITTLGVLHFLWLVKADILQPMILGIILITLLALRSPALKISHRS